MSAPMRNPSITGLPLVALASYDGFGVLPSPDGPFDRPSSSPPLNGPAMPTIQALDHIAIATKDLDGALAFWQAQLGLVCEHIEELPERGIKVAFLPVGNTRIELVCPLPGREADSEVSKFLTDRGGGIHHIALRTDDVDGDTKAMADAGARIAQQPSPGAHNCRVAFVHPKSTGGVLLELSTPQGDH